MNSEEEDELLDEYVEEQKHPTNFTFSVSHSLIKFSAIVLLIYLEKILFQNLLKYSY